MLVGRPNCQHELQEPKDRDGLTNPSRYSAEQADPSYAMEAEAGGDVSPKRKSSLVSQILCITIAILRATATIAFEMPTRLASRTPHALIDHHFFDRSSIAVAASTSR